MAESPLELLEESLDILGDSVHLEEANGPTSHTAILVTQLDDATVTTAVGRYLVGVIGGAVQHDARCTCGLSQESITRSGPRDETRPAAWARVPTARVTVRGRGRWRQPMNAVPPSPPVERPGGEADQRL
jgi:hypothetical protein